MANDVKLQSPEGKHPVDENLRPILVGGKATAIETAQHGNGVKVNGDFEATGETKGITASQISYPAFFRFNGNHGVHFNRNNLVSGSILFGDDSTSLLLRSAPGGTDYLSFQVALNGKTTISTIDFVGNEADLVIVVDGYIDMNSASGEDITLDSGDDIILDADGGEIYLKDGASTFGEFSTAASKVGFTLYESAGGADTFKTTCAANGATTLATNDVDGADANLAFSADGDLIFSSTNGAFVTKNGGNEFSVANSAYAGMILGYTTVGIDVADDSKALSTSFVTTDSAHNVSFKAPPSGVVEIFVSIYGDFNRRQVFLGLSDNATYNTLDATHEHSVSLPGSANDVEIRHSWVITGLTPNTTYKYWLGAKSSHILSNTLRWGGDATGEYAPFIMKATALPTAVTDFAVYG